MCSLPKRPVLLTRPIWMVPKIRPTCAWWRGEVLCIDLSDVSPLLSKAFPLSVLSLSFQSLFSPIPKSYIMLPTGPPGSTLPVHPDSYPFLVHHVPAHPEAISQPSPKQNCLSPPPVCLARSSAFAFLIQNFKDWSNLGACIQSSIFSWKEWLCWLQEQPGGGLGLGVSWSSAYSTT